MDKKRGSFSNKMGFVLAAAGSAVGLGNPWRFSCLAAKYGGGIFSAGVSDTGSHFGIYPHDYRNCYWTQDRSQRYRCFQSAG